MTSQFTCNGGHTALTPAGCDGSIRGPGPKCCRAVIRDAAFAARLLCAAVIPSVSGGCSHALRRHPGCQLRADAHHRCRRCGRQIIGGSAESKRLCRRHRCQPLGCVSRAACQTSWGDGLRRRRRRRRRPGALGMHCRTSKTGIAHVTDHDQFDRAALSPRSVSTLRH